MAKQKMVSRFELVTEEQAEWLENQHRETRQATRKVPSTQSIPLMLEAKP